MRFLTLDLQIFTCPRVLLALKHLLKFKLWFGVILNNACVLSVAGSTLAVQ